MLKDLKNFEHWLDAANENSTPDCMWHVYTYLQAMCIRCAWSINEFYVRLGSYLPNILLYIWKIPKPEKIMCLVPNILDKEYWNYMEARVAKVSEIQMVKGRKVTVVEDNWLERRCTALWIFLHERDPWRLLFPCSNPQKCNSSITLDSQSSK